MRVIAGMYGSRRLKAVPGDNTRPTTDKIKESVFNMLGGSFASGICLDFYGGSGGIAIEAVSRGMDFAVITEKFRPAIQTIEENIRQLNASDKFVILKGPNRQSLNKYHHTNPGLQFDLVFLDPPYAKQMIVEDIEWLDDQGLLKENTQIVCETDVSVELPLAIKSWQQMKQKKYGQTLITIYERG